MCPRVRAWSRWKVSYPLKCGANLVVDWAQSTFVIFSSSFCYILCLHAFILILAQIHNSDFVNVAERCSLHRPGGARVILRVGFLALPCPCLEWGGGGRLDSKCCSFMCELESMWFWLFLVCIETFAQHFNSWNGLLSARVCTCMFMHNYKGLKIRKPW